jgi:CheY-like chemotaxis protein/HPt (histidine-containing phosphotransfer) domain-containing protein
VAHDLRTALNGLWSTSELLLATPLEPGQRECACIIRRSAEAIRRLADELAGVDTRDSGPSSEHERPESSEDVRPLRVLVVDDDPVGRMAVLRMLELLGHRGEGAADGTDALAAVGQGEFDVVLMDVQMGDVGGPEAARRMRRSRLGGRCPRILGVTGSALAADRDACRAAGMEVVLVKPLDLATLRAALASQLAALRPTLAPDADEILNSRIEAHLRSRQSAAESLALAKFVDLYTADAPEQIARLHAAGARQDAAELAVTAHRLTGSSLAIGAVRLSALASKIEVLARSGDVSGAVSLIVDLERAWPATRDALASVNTRAAEVG